MAGQERGKIRRCQEEHVPFHRRKREGGATSRSGETSLGRKKEGPSRCLIGIVVDFRRREGSFIEASGGGELRVKKKKKKNATPPLSQQQQREKISFEVARKAPPVWQRKNCEGNPTGVGAGRTLFSTSTTRMHLEDHLAKREQKRAPRARWPILPSPQGRGGFRRWKRTNVKRGAPQWVQGRRYP